MEKIFLNTLSKAINRYLALDKNSAQRLISLQNKVIKIELLPFHFIFYCVFKPAGVEVNTDHTQPADTIIRGTPLQFTRLMLSTDKREAFFTNDIEIEGSADLGQQVVHLFNELEIDWEDNLSHLIGDIPTHYLADVGKKARDGFAYLKKAMTLNIDEYLHEEKNWLPAREALNDFFTDIDQLRLDTDRLAAKIERIKHEIHHSHTSPDSH